MKLVLFLIDSEEYLIESVEASGTYPPVETPRASYLEKLGAKFDAFLEDNFTRWGRFCARNPYTVLIIGMTCVAAMSAGLKYFTVITDPVDLWSTSGNLARQEKEYFDSHFGYEYLFYPHLKLEKKLFFIDSLSLK